jgi:hypothetical protein
VSALAMVTIRLRYEALIYINMIAVGASSPSLRDTARAFLALDDRAKRVLQDPYRENDFDALLACLKPVAHSINELNRSLGLSDAYPFELTSAIIGKLHLVHMAIERFRHAAAWNEHC